jgi:ElaB/YqjD/DUF883 family membrane-anchored ribosome-binding protein
MNTTEVTEKLQDLQKRATEAVRNAGQAADHYVRDNTWTAVGIAAVVGCVVGYLLAGDREG